MTFFCLMSRWLKGIHTESSYYRKKNSLCPNIISKRNWKYSFTDLKKTASCKGIANHIKLTPKEGILSVVWGNFRVIKWIVHQENKPKNVRALKSRFIKQEQNGNTKPSSHSCSFFLNKIKPLIYTITESDLIYIYGTLK